MQQVSQAKMQFLAVVIGITLTTLITGGAHLYLAMQPDEDLRFWFLLNGLGYLGLLFMFLLPRFARAHSLIRWIFIGYTLLTIVLWFFLGSPSEGWPWDPFDTTVKTVEVILVILLCLDFRQYVAGAYKRR
ncbi:DUF7475 family protein [Dictyobacter aurantiacus]|uniref:Uncharacterized protein n=1 Tax=Dictyobacter aurantiacus TaxID=1936993 RepID=A0A401ZSK7_9CHLR|nr:hypothetical protein [Dictyobacter aurantiacus]GCE09764.1 hypothetical protein KDAU_70930 [Dictyobacter aurantiacus]